VELADSIFRWPVVLAVCALVLAMALGALLTLIVAELRKRLAAEITSHTRPSPVRAHSAEEIERRQSLVKQLIGLYSGVHSVDALSSFLNNELERRHERWRVRIPAEGPGEFYDIDP
jgi:hypothetical protein